MRDIPIWDGMVEDGVNVYKAKNIEEFTEKIKLILENELPSLKNNTRKIAEERDLKIIGKKLKDVYESLYQ